MIPLRIEARGRVVEEKAAGHGGERLAIELNQPNLHRHAEG
jgi:hypothetical protein